MRSFGYSVGEKWVICLAGVVGFWLSFTPGAFAMHITEGFLPVGHAVAWGAICLPFVVAGVLAIKKVVAQRPKALILLAMCGAYAFVLSGLKIPSVTGSSSHATGTGLGAILFGPVVMSVLGMIVLIFQALLLAHGGLTTLGANTFSMAIAGPFLAFGVYRVGEKLRLNRKVTIFLAACLGDLFTYLVTSVQLALAHPSGGSVGSSLGKFLGIFAVTQIPLAIIEGVLTVCIVIGLEAYARPELREIGYLGEMSL